MDVWIVNTADDGVLGGGATPELAKAVAAEKVDDYFGNPIKWKTWNEGTPEEHYMGEYYSYAHDTALVYVERVEIKEA